jgi:hypothetical protein
MDRQTDAADRKCERPTDEPAEQNTSSTENTEHPRTNPKDCFALRALLRPLASDASFWLFWRSRVLALEQQGAKKAHRHDGKANVGQFQ